MHSAQHTVQFAVWGPWIFVNRLSEALVTWTCVICLCRRMVKILWVMICLHPNCKNVAPKHQHRPPVIDKPSATDPHARRADGVELGWQQIRVAVVVMDVGTTLVPTPLWQSGKQSFPSVFPPICLVFISRPPTYKGKLSTISIFRWFIAFGSGTSRGCANLCQGFWVGGGSPLSHQSSTRSCCCSHTCPDATDFAVTE